MKIGGKTFKCVRLINKSDNFQEKKKKKNMFIKGNIMRNTLIFYTAA